MNDLTGYELIHVLKTTPPRVFQARHRATGQTVQIHFLPGLGEEQSRQLLHLLRLRQKPNGPVLAFDLEAPVPFAVTTEISLQASLPEVLMAPPRRALPPWAAALGSALLLAAVLGLAYLLIRSQ